MLLHAEYRHAAEAAARRGVTEGTDIRRSVSAAASVAACLRRCVCH